MRIDPTSLAREPIHPLMTGIVVPRPIAWVTSLSRSGVLNLAPFSAFTFAPPPRSPSASAAKVSTCSCRPCGRR